MSGLAFTLETDAYEMLRDYLDTLKKTYAKDEAGREIVADIEARIVELILSTQDNARVVERPLIANIIAQLGTAEDISEESAIDDTATKTPHGEPRIPRRLYRDMENARLGGVCSGLAKYFNIEIPWVRLACCSPVILILIGGITPFMHWMDRFGVNLLWVVAISYLIMWIAVPAARTARQKLEANGEKITVQSIRDASAGGVANDVDRKARPVIAETVTVFGRIVIFLLKMFAALIIFALILIALMLFIGMWVVMFSSVEVFTDAGSVGEILLGISNSRMLCVLGVVAVLIPIFILLYVLCSLVLGSKVNRWVLLVLFLLWIASIISLPVVAIRNQPPYMHHNYTVMIDNRHNSDEDRTLRDSIDEAAENYVLPVADTVVIRNVATEDLPSIDLD